MSNKQKYNNVFKDILNLKDEDFNIEIVFSDTVGWDSIGHMLLISKIEETFDIFLDTDDVLNFSSYSEGKKILKKHNIVII